MIKYKIKYSSVVDKYTNGECVAFVGFLYQYNDCNGQICDIDLIPTDDFGDLDYEDRIYHSVYFF